MAIPSGKMRRLAVEVNNTLRYSVILRDQCVPLENFCKEFVTSTSSKMKGKKYFYLITSAHSNNNNNNNNNNKNWIQYLQIW